jgi:plasmid rolling circle replication initiator protein Rep
MCAWRRSLKIFGQLSKVMDYMTENHDYKYVFLTLTVKNVFGDDLSVTMDKLFYAFKLFTKRKEFKKISNGWFRCFEVTHNWERDDYHPHFHMVIAVNKNYFFNSDLYLSQERWTELWRSCLFIDYDPIVDIRLIKDNGEGNKKAVAEVAKYAVKAADFMIRPSREFRHFEFFVDACQKKSDEAVSVFDSALYNRRLVAFGGEFKRIHKMLNLDDIDNGDLVNTDISDDIRDDLNYVLVVYRWVVGIGDYIEFY